MKNKIVTYKIAKELKNIGYAEGSDYCITQFDDDFIYDEDPNHSESHKKGDIRLYNMYYKNNDDYIDNMCEAPLWNDVKDWLREKKNIDIDIITCFTYALQKRKAYAWNVYGTVTENDHDLNLIGSSFFMDGTYTNALENAIDYVIKYIKENESEKSI